MKQTLGVAVLDVVKYVSKSVHCKFTGEAVIDPGAPGCPVELVEVVSVVHEADGKAKIRCILARIRNNACLCWSELEILHENESCTFCVQ